MLAPIFLTAFLFGCVCAEADEEEPMLVENKNRFVLFPIKYKA